MRAWRKSTFSISGECVEVGQEAAGDYRKSSLSMNNGACTEVGSGPAGILVRDTTDRDGPFLSFPRGAWARFTAGITGAGS
jgi:uncharacterized protein DUF397